MTYVCSTSPKQFSFKTSNCAGISARPFGSFLVASDACAAAGSGCLARSKADKMNRKRLNTSSMPSTSKIVRIQVNSAENEEIIASWLNESDESSADENDYIQSDRVVDSEDEYCDDEEATACDLDSASSRRHSVILYCRAN
ncbi:hypothetical protein EVAR_100473_1 [Eumeta japonica]|uniref:Uncharacterized protein n=1 Tax=Eumeta variegata TaxID=151549 RepID=A0A4C1SEQ7_EUMVA|nr:hypothetical protein EVAR_100473_1 [Eumeta japonica]